MKKKINILFIVFLCFTLGIVFFGGEKMKLISVEDLDIYVGAGVGINKYGEGDIRFRIPATVSKYKEDGSIESVINTGVGSTIGKTRENRQNKIGKQLFFGLAKIYLIEEEYARYGIKDLVDVNFKNPGVNNRLYLVVCKGRSEDYFNINVPGYDNSAEFISDMIKNSVKFNFFKEGYMLQNAVLSMDAEGKNIVSPYIEIGQDGIVISGISVFKKDKLAVILNMKDTKIMNMLRENKVSGILTIQKNSKEYVNYSAESKRKITCKKTGGKYTFIIDLDLKGEIVNNGLYEGMTVKNAIIKKFEDDMSKQVENMCVRFVDKMKKEYKVDLLQLGWVATAKYGRDTGVNWDEVVSNSDIKVNVKVHVGKVGRGQY
ncbi:Ger(x)C family spore germination protein [Clostridium estertheticum]|uniref:Ger(x)C family spore germination protein n=1 Tax=Clostridium estertheticum TaxID=238834 RepID=UPI001CF148F1|nr:Ger(x)C family spore germination protein [Clostridium estertheticum]MCB2352831.1 Ger(x)C family spore germination protein [Clostridium estertheticum]WAG40137.1 Ger(x)C family spore germination protein [Clostridium estertheticum]